MAKKRTPKKADFVTVRDPRDSVWQSMVERVAKQEIAEAKAPQARGAAAEGAAKSASTRQAELRGLIDAANTHIWEKEELSQGRVPDTFTALAAAIAPVPTARGVAAAPPKISATEKAKRCATLALQLAKAKVFGSAAQVQALQNAFDFNVCDPFWERCINEYVEHFKLGDGKIPYREGVNNVLDTPLAGNARIALFGDWGTGMPVAVDLLQQIKGFKPDILMHLGDVYYSGTQDEMQERYLDVCDAVFGAQMPIRFSLSGNHDMYSGGAGYYWLVDQLGQRASYFAFQNENWLFIGMDTGIHDFNPLQGGSVASFLMQSEADWVNGLVAASGGKNVVFLSHHPPFSAYDSMSGAAVNPLLLTQIVNSLPRVAFWFWGHEHRLGVYDSFQNVKRGRCLGHGAVPVFADDDGDPPKLPGVPVHQEDGAPLDMGTADNLFKHGFAIMTLSGKNATVDYYRQGDANPLWTESV